MIIRSHLRYRYSINLSFKVRKNGQLLYIKKGRLEFDPNDRKQTWLCLR